MPGPDPAETRRRTNTPKKEADRVVLPPEGRQGRAPAVPTPVKLLKASREQWKAWWSSPMATMWDERFDVFPLARLLSLYDMMRRDGGVPAATLTEMRQLEARFGLEPRSRKELCWVIGEPEEAAPSPKREDTDELAERRRRVSAKAAGA